MLTSSARWWSDLLPFPDKKLETFKDSKHFALQQQFKLGLVSERQQVTCATCHMPRTASEDQPGASAAVLVHHNQNMNLRPNEKMIRTV